MNSISQLSDDQAKYFVDDVIGENKLETYNNFISQLVANLFGWSIKIETKVGENTKVYHLDKAHFEKWCNQNNVIKQGKSLNKYSFEALPGIAVGYLQKGYNQKVEKLKKEGMEEKYRKFFEVKGRLVHIAGESFNDLEKKKSKLLDEHGYALNMDTRELWVKDPLYSNVVRNFHLEAKNQGRDGISIQYWGTDCLFTRLRPDKQAEFHNTVNKKFSEEGAESVINYLLEFVKEVGVL